VKEDTPAVFFERFDASHVHCIAVVAKIQSVGVGNAIVGRFGVNGLISEGSGAFAAGLFVGGAVHFNYKCNNQAILVYLFVLNHIANMIIKMKMNQTCSHSYLGIYVKGLSYTNPRIDVLTLLLLWNRFSTVSRSLFIGPKSTSNPFFIASIATELP
jgi:hypothetical protein